MTLKMWCLQKTGQVNDMINDREYISAVNLPSGSKKYIKDEEVREVVQGIDSTANNYIEMKSGQREYLSTTVPTGNIPIGSVGMGFDEGVFTYKSGTKVSEGEKTANLFDAATAYGDMYSDGVITGQGNAINDIKNKVTADMIGKTYTISITPLQISSMAFVAISINGTLYWRENELTVNQRRSFQFTPVTENDQWYITYDKTGVSSYKDIMLNLGSTPLPYEPYGKQKFPFYANGSNLTDYTIYGATGGVGDEVTDSESTHYGEYDIPVICGNATTHIYLTSPLGANDSIDYTTSQVAIPTVDGANNLICDTTVQPSKVSLTYTGWHSDDTIARKVMGIAETGNDHIKMGNGITLYISATQPQNPSEGDLWIGG